MTKYILRTCKYLSQVQEKAMRIKRKNQRETR
eukprot:UN16346